MYSDYPWMSYGSLAKITVMPFGLKHELVPLYTSQSRDHSYEESLFRIILITSWCIYSSADIFHVEDSGSKSDNFAFILATFSLFSSLALSSEMKSRNRCVLRMISLTNDSKFIETPLHVEYLNSSSGSVINKSK